MSISTQQIGAPHPDDLAVAEDWVVDGTWFYAPNEHEFYQLKATSDTDAFHLDRGTVIETVECGETDQSVGEGPATYPIHSVDALAGEIEGGYLHGIPPEGDRDLGTAFAVDVGEYLLVAPPKTREDGYLPPLSPASLSARHTDLSAATTAAVTKDRAGALSPPLIILGHEDSTGLSRLLEVLGHTNDGPTQTSSRSTQSTRDADQTAVAGDGGTMPADAYVPEEATAESVAVYENTDESVVSRYIDTSEHPAATFEEPNLRRFVRHWISDCPRVLNACAGPTELTHPTGGEILRNDLNPDVDADLHVDVAELAAHFESESFDCIIFDPPWTVYQSNLRYAGYHVRKQVTDDGIPVRNIDVDVRDLPFHVPGEGGVGQQGGPGTQAGLAQFAPDHQPKSAPDGGESKQQLGHARLAKLGFDYLLKPGGRVIQFAYNGTVMPSKLEYDRLVRYPMDPHGEGRTLMASVDQKSD